MAVEVEALVSELSWRAACEIPSEISRTRASILGRLLTGGPQRVTALAQSEPVAQPTMSMIVKRLEQRGLVERRADPDDRRASLVAITAAGEAMLREHAEHRAQWFEARLAALGDAERDQVAAAVRRLRDVFE